MSMRIVNYGSRSVKDLTWMSEKIFHLRGNKVHVTSIGDDSLPTIVFIHGFTGSTKSWDETIGLLKGKYRTIAVDLTGHGKSSVPEEATRYSMEEQVADLEALFAKLELSFFILVGYSMGGRIGLAYTIKHPERISTLILESASPGLKAKSERVARKEADKRLSEKIIEEGIPAFVELWENVPIFRSQKELPNEKQKAIRTERLSQNATGLANSLLGIGSGSQPSFWDDLPTIKVPILLVTGEIDIKFVNIAREMMKYLPSVSHQTIKSAGHAIHVEKPTLFATIVDEHIMKVIKLRG